MQYTPWLEPAVPIWWYLHGGSARTNLSHSCSCFAPSPCEFVLALHLAFEQHVGADPENADEDAHDRFVILFVLRRTRLQNLCGFGDPPGSNIGVFTPTEAQSMFY